MVLDAIAPHRSQDPQGDGDDYGQKKPRGSQPEGHGHTLQNQAQSRSLGDEGFAEIPPGHAGQKLEVLDDDRPIQAHLLSQHGYILFCCFRRQEDQDRITEKMKQGKSDQADPPDNDQGLEEPVEDVRLHG